MSIQRGVILIKDNLLAKRNWSGSKKCPFCDLNETIQHLLFDCQHAKTIWRVVYVATGLTPLKSITHVFRNWLSGIRKKEKSLIFVGAAALMWAIWCTRNDLIFEKKIFTSFILVFSGEREDIRKTVCLAKALKIVSLDIFVKNGWTSNNRLWF